MRKNPTTPLVLITPIWVVRLANLLTQPLTMTSLSNLLRGSHVLPVISGVLGFCVAYSALEYAALFYLERF